MSNIVNLSGGRCPPAPPAKGVKNPFGNPRIAPVSRGARIRKAVAAWRLQQLFYVEEGGRLLS